MGIRNALQLVQTQRTVAEAVGLAPVGTVAVSEGAVQTLDPAAAAAFGITGSGRIDRKAAMRIPAVRRGRSLIAGTIGTLPLVCTRSTAGGGVEQIDRQLLRQLDPRTTPAWTLTWTVDDLLFHGIAWWRVTDREVVGGERIGYPTAIERLAPGRVFVDLSSGQAYVDGEPASDADLIRFDGPDEGVLENGSGPGGVLPLALALQSAAKRNADDDVPTMLLNLVAGATELTPTQITELLDEWEAARRERRTAYTNAAIEAEALNFDASKRQLTELGQFTSSELARLLNLPASRIGAPQGSGMTYANIEADRRDLVDTTLALYLTPIWQRLSMGDVTPNGQTVSWDLSAYLRGDTTQLVSSGAAAIAAGLTDAPEVRTRWLGLPPRSDLPAPTPAPATPERTDPNA